MDPLLQLAIPRTSGDGMEEQCLSATETKIKQLNAEKVINEKHKSDVVEKRFSANVTLPGQHVNIRHAGLQVGRTSTVPIKRLYYLIPRLVDYNKTPAHKKTRQPRFIPLEPYKAAVNPIIPPRKPFRMKKNRNNLDINILVSQMSNMKSTELYPVGEKDKNSEKTDYEKERDMFLKEIEELKKDRDKYQNKVQYQANVNSELKNLLVAALTEDMQTKVNLLTEDKIQLARALDDTVKNLSKHAEQIESLTGQCEVWRSKFLASSVMIEELARWKSDLSYKNTLLAESNKKMLHLTSYVRENQLHLLKNLKFLGKIRNLNIPKTDIITLTSECLNITQQMIRNSETGVPDNLSYSELNSLTDAEKCAIEALEFSNQPLMSTDNIAIKSPIFGNAFPTMTSSNCTPKPAEIFTITAYNNNNNINNNKS